MDNHPLITIITPTYNRADYLEETIQSVLLQDYPHIEYIIINDGSVADTPKLLKNIQKKLSSFIRTTRVNPKRSIKVWRMQAENGRLLSILMIRFIPMRSQQL